MTEETTGTTASPFPETADIETSSDDYASRFSGKTGAWFLEVQANIAVKLLAMNSRSTILDVGGGHGQLAEPFCRAGYRVTILGSDESCRKRVAGLIDSARCDFKIGNVIDLPFDDRSMDATASFRLLPHCEQWPKLVAELCRVARERVVVDYPAITGINALAPMLFSAKQKVEKNTRVWRQFKHHEVIAAFEQNGFRLVARRGQFFLPMVLHRALRCRTLSRLLEGACGLVGLRRLFGSPVIAVFERKAQ